MRVPRSLYSEERLKGVREGLSKKKLVDCGVLYNGCAKYRTEIVQVVSRRFAWTMPLY